MNRRKLLTILFLFSFLSSVNSQSTYNVRIMSWNVLNYPDPSGVSADTALRNPYFREVIQYINPDIFMITELATTTGYNLFLNNVMNASGIGQFSTGTFINGPDTDNEIYFRTSGFQYISNTPIQTALRDISEFKLVHIPTGDTIRIYGCHLKASSGISNEAQRSAEVDSLRKVTNALPAGSDFIVCGDFNIYGDYEQAYMKLMQDNITDDGNFIDVLNLPGIWNQAIYSPNHTQSTRFGSVGGGAPGGMNDRFDMMHFSNAVIQPGRITYVSNSFTNIGNDGMHYNQSINVMPNTAVPQNIADALYWTSDHLPVYCDFEFASTTGINEQVFYNSEINIFPNPVKEIFNVQCSLFNAGEIKIKIFNVLGKEVLNSAIHPDANGQSVINISSLNPGVYFVSFLTGEILKTKKLIITSK